MSNLLFISPQPVFGGAATANIAIAKMLAAKGLHVTYNDEYMKESCYNDFEIDHTALHNSPKRNQNLMSFVQDKNFDSIIWGDVSIFIYFLPSIRRMHKMGLKQYAVFHSLCLEQNLKSYIIEHTIAFTLRYMDKYVFVSDYTLRSWSKYRMIRNKADKLVSIHNPMSIPTFSKNFNANEPRIGFVGRFSAEKQPHVFCSLSDETRFQYIAYGDGPLLDDMKSKYRNVVFKGSCRDTNEIYSNIDILVMTSKFENCPMVILEAKVRGIPCVVPKVGGIPEIVAQGVDGEIYEQYDQDIIKKAIQRVVENYDHYSRNCIKKAKLTEPEVVVEKWMEIL